MHWKNYLAIVLEIVLAFAHRQLLDRRAFTGQSSSQSRHFTVGTRRDLRRVSLKASKTVRSVYGHVKGVHIVNILLRRVGKTKKSISLAYRKHSSISSCNFRFPVCSLIWYSAIP